MKTILSLSFVIFLFLAVPVAFAQQTGLTYQPVVEIPGLDPNAQSTDQYVNALYLLAITVAALLAVVKIIFGGVKWMLSDVVTDKASAKKDIWGAILGLLIVLGTVIILNTINPNLTRLNFLENATPLNITVSTPTNGGNKVVPITKGMQTIFHSEEDFKSFEERCDGSVKRENGNGNTIIAVCN